MREQIEKAVDELHYWLESDTHEGKYCYNLRDEDIVNLIIEREKKQCQDCRLFEVSLLGVTPNEWIEAEIAKARVETAERILNSVNKILNDWKVIHTCQEIISENTKKGDL